MIALFMINLYDYKLRIFYNFISRTPLFKIFKLVKEDLIRTTLISLIYYRILSFGNRWIILHSEVAVNLVVRQIWE